MSPYNLKSSLPQEISKALAEFDGLQQQLLYNRGLNTASAAKDFLDFDYDRDRHDPYLLPDMEVAVERVLKAISDQEKIGIFSDYDCDGIPGAVVAHDFFKAIGHQETFHYIPHRHYEGFGLSVEAVEKIHKEGVTLLITIDCGTSNQEAIDKADALGMAVIVTDHHEPTTKTKAVATVNPKMNDNYPFPHLCGAAVFFKLVEAILQKNRFGLPEGQEKWWLDMVGLATIGDMVPLVGENRIYASYGLKVLRKSRRPGLSHLLKKTGSNRNHLTEDDIGFTIGPRINAASRMDLPEDAFYMLSSREEEEAGTYVAHLEKLNNERKGVVAAMSKELNHRLKEFTEIPSVIVMGSNEWRPSLVGLTASSVAKNYKRPVFLWGRDGNGEFKGSCRSDGTISVVTLMEEAKDAFLEYGGHHMSGGFSVKDNKIWHLAEVLNQAFESRKEEAVVEETLEIDGELSLEAVDNNLLNTLEKFSPYGAGNPKPVFLFKGVTPDKVEFFGKGKEHIRLRFKTSGLAREALAFFKTLEEFSVPPKEGAPCSLLAHVEKSFFMGRMQTRLRIVEVLP